VPLRHTPNISLLVIAERVVLDPHAVDVLDLARAW
jgi:hypothetical protein